MNDTWLGVSATRTAWSANVENSAQRLVLLAVARYADDKGCSFPSAETICADTKLNRKTVFKALNDLKRLGCVSVSKGANNRNNYSISSSTKNGTTENGTTEFGTSQKRYDSSTKNGTTVVPNLVREEYQEEKQEENKKDARPKAEPSVRGVSEKLVEIYNQTTKGYFPQVKALTDKRRQVCKKWIAFFRKQSNSANVPEFLEHAREYFISATQLTFLTGNNDRGWKADFDFLMNVNKTVMLLEGKYANKKSQEQIAQEKHDALWKLPTPANNSPTPEQLEGSFQDFALAFQRITTRAS